MGDTMLRNILIALVLATTTELLILFGLVVYWRARREVPVQPRLCIPSTVFMNSADVLQKLEKEHDKYCGDASYVLDILVNETVADRYNSNANPEQEHLTLDWRGDKCTPSDADESMLKLDSITSHAKPVTGRPTKIHWKSGTNVHKSLDLQHLIKDGSILVQKSGRYYVSSQLTSRVGNMAVSESFDKTMKHFVFLISHKNKTERILLEDTKSPCKLTVDQSEHTSNMAAVFSLEEKDQIYVATSHPYHLLTGDNVNYLSVHKT